MLPLSVLAHVLTVLAAAAPHQPSSNSLQSLEPRYFQPGLSGQQKIGNVPAFDSKNNAAVPFSQFPKRANSTSYPQTYFTFGDKKLVWGCDIDPATTLGNLSQICPASGSCISTEPYTQPIMYTVPKTGGYTTLPVPESLVISATGFFTNGLQETVIQAVQAAVSASGVIQWDRGQKWASTILPLSPREDIPPAAEYKGTCDLATFSSFIGVVVQSSATTVDAHVEITIAVPDLDDGFCGSLETGVDGLVGAVASSIGKLAGVADVFGIISAVCALANAL